jgi:hypothetical protein
LQYDRSSYSERLDACYRVAPDLNFAPRAARDCVFSPRAARDCVFYGRNSTFAMPSALSDVSRPRHGSAETQVEYGIGVSRAGFEISDMTL